MNWFLFCGVFALLGVGVIGTPDGAISESVDPVTKIDSKIESNDATSNGSKYDWVDTWVAPGRLKEWMPWFTIGNDNEGSPVYVVLYGKWNFRDAVTKGTKEEIEGIGKYFDQVVDSFSRDAEKSSTGGAVFIFDYDGFGLSNYAHPEAIRLSLKQFTKIGKIYKALEQGYGINANFAAELFINSARPFMGSLLEKIDIYGTQREKWVPRLLQRIPKEVLPVKYGGQNKEFDF